MDKPTTITGEHIQHLITKFFYQNNQLGFQILLRYRWNETIVFGEYQNKAAYQKAFAFLQHIRSENLPVVATKEKIASNM